MVILDDFDHTWLRPKEFKRLFDAYPLDVQYKGGYRAWNPKLVVITSNEDPAVWFSGEHWPMVKRRIETYYYFYADKAYVKSNDYDTVIRLYKQMTSYIGCSSEASRVERSETHISDTD